MITTQKQISDLIPYANNNKKHGDDQIAGIAKSLKEYGRLQPVVIDKNNVIVAGHGRVEAAKTMGMEEAPCVITEDLTEEQIRKYRLIDNKLSELAEWDLENIQMEIEALNDLELAQMFDIDLTPSDEDFSGKNKDIDPDDLFGDEKTSVCPKCHFEFLPE